MAPMDDSPSSSIGTSDVDPSAGGQVLDDDYCKSDSGQSESSSSRSASPEPRKPAQAKVKRPPYPFVRGEDRVRKMLPRFVLPRCLDPRCVAVRAPTELPLCWLGVPFSFGLIENYADNTGLGVPVTEGYHSRIPGSVDLMKTWLVIIDNFYEDTGIHMDIEEVWGAEYPIITFISNRQTCDITMDQHDAIEDMLEDMGVKKEDGPMWYLDRWQLY